MPIENELIEALPWDEGPTFPTNKHALRNYFWKRSVHSLETNEDPEQWVARDVESGAVPVVVAWNGRFWWLNEDDSYSDGDLVTSFRSYDGWFYEVEGVECWCIKYVRSRSVDTPPDSGVEIGEAFLIPTGAGAEWAGFDNHKALWTARGWEIIAPRIGEWIYVDDEDLFVRYKSTGEWSTGQGALTAEPLSIPLSAVINFGKFVIVENQTLDAPAGSRKTGGTPTMPLGGTAANINDNDPTTTATTSALGNLTGATQAGRIFARLALAAATDLIAIDAKGLKVSTGSSTALAVGIYYSTNNGASWTQAGAGLTLTTTATDHQRTGSFLGVTDIALITEAKNWSTATHTVGDLNAYDATVTCSVGSAWIVGPNPFGVLAGHATKVAICEVADTLTIYDPPNGMRAFDKDEAADYQRRSGAWARASGLITSKITRITSTTVYSKPANLVHIRVHAVAGGGSGNGGVEGNGTNGGTTSFGTLLTAIGGTKGGASSGSGNGAGGTGGTQSGQQGDVIRLPGNVGATLGVGGTSRHPWAQQTTLYGSGGSVGGNGGGGGGETAIADFLAETLGSSESITIGAGGNAPVGGSVGIQGVVFLEEFLEV